MLPASNLRMYRTARQQVKSSRAASAAAWWLATSPTLERRHHNVSMSSAAIANRSNIAQAYHRSQSLASPIEQEAIVPHPPELVGDRASRFLYHSKRSSIVRGKSPKAKSHVHLIQNKCVTNYPSVRLQTS